MFGFLSNHFSQRKPFEPDSKLQILLLKLCSFILSHVSMYLCCNYFVSSVQCNKLWEFGKFHNVDPTETVIFSSFISAKMYFQYSQRRNKWLNVLSNISKNKRQKSRKNRVSNILRGHHTLKVISRWSFI